MLARAHTFTIDGLRRPARDGRGRRPRRACPRSRSSGSPTPPCARRASGSRRRSATPATSSRRGGSPRTSRPGDLPKAGPGLDLALACAVLAASGQIPRRSAGAPRAVRRAGARRHRAARPRHAGGRPAPRARPACAAGAGAARAPREAALVEGLEVRAVEHLRSAVRVLGGGAGDAAARARRGPTARPRRRRERPRPRCRT